MSLLPSTTPRPPFLLVLREAGVLRRRFVGMGGEWPYNYGMQNHMHTPSPLPPSLPEEHAMYVRGKLVLEICDEWSPSDTGIKRSLEVFCGTAHSGDDDVLALLPSPDNPSLSG